MPLKRSHYHRIKSMHRRRREVLRAFEATATRKKTERVTLRVLRQTFEAAASSVAVDAWRTTFTLLSFPVGSATRLRDIYTSHKCTNAHEKHLVAGEQLEGVLRATCVFFLHDSLFFLAR